MINEIIQGSALEKLRELESESVDCCITSPPYWALRDYKTESIIWDSYDGCAHEWKEDANFHFGSGDRKQTMRPNSRPSEIYATKIPSNFCSKCNAWRGSLGLEPTFDLYIRHLLQIFNEVKRVLKKEGSCWVDIGDVYNGNKSLCLIPQRFVIAMVEQGWICRNTIIWYKPNCMPSSAKDRFTVDFEYLFFFTKSQRYYFDTQYEPHQEQSIERDKYGHRAVPKAWTADAIPNGIAKNKNLNFHLGEHGRIKRCVWKIPTQPFSDAHFAVFPPELVETPIKATCPVEGLVLDPFLGSGTTAIVAMQNARNFIGIELNPEYIKMAYARLDPYLKQERLQFGQA